MFACMCLSVCECLLTTSPVSVGAITEIRQCYSNGCPRLSARILCQDNKLKGKRMRVMEKGGRDCGGRRNMEAC